MKIETLIVNNFKSFKDATFDFPQLTLILGSNASGKSNVRDALRFMHGIGRGYSLAEILGGGYREGVQVWSGIRGGTRELCRYGENRCFLATMVGAWSYIIGMEILKKDAMPRVVHERLSCGKEILYQGDANGKDTLNVNLLSGGDFRKAHVETFASSRPILPRIGEKLEERNRNDDRANRIRTGAKAVLDALQGLRFLDLAPDAMRIPSIPGETHLGDRGENLSSVMQGLCSNEKTAASIAARIAELTPMDVTAFEFKPDAAGKVLITLVEADGRKVSANSASDGTLRFLGILAALIGEDSGTCFFLEEIDNGIHPARLDLIMKFLREPPGSPSRRPSVISTTHAPSLLRLLGVDGLGNAILTYRPEKCSETRAVCLKDVKGIRDALANGDLASLHESSWFEDVLAFTEETKVAS